MNDIFLLIKKVVLSDGTFKMTITYCGYSSPYFLRRNEIKSGPSLRHGGIMSDSKYENQRSLFYSLFFKVAHSMRMRGKRGHFRRDQSVAVL